MNFDEILQLQFENDTGEFFNGRVSDENKEKLENYLKKLNYDQKQTFFLKYLKNQFLNEIFIESGAGLEDLDEIIDWIRYTYY